MVSTLCSCMLGRTSKPISLLQGRLEKRHMCSNRLLLRSTMPSAAGNGGLQSAAVWRLLETLTSLSRTLARMPRMRWTSTQKSVQLHDLFLGLRQIGNASGVQPNSAPDGGPVDVGRLWLMGSGSAPLAHPSILAISHRAHLRNQTGTLGNSRMNATNATSRTHLPTLCPTLGLHLLRLNGPC